MLAKTIIAASALLSMTAAVPLQQQNKRDVVWETRTTWDITTMQVTTTVWLAPGEAAPTGDVSPLHYGHHHKKPKQTSTIQHTVTVQPSPAQSSPAAQSPSSSAAQSPSSPYVAPTPSSPAAPDTTSAAPTTQSTPAASPSSSPSSGGGNYASNGLTGAAAAGTEYTGDFTWYQTGLGACGITSSPSDHIVAVSEDLFDIYNIGSNPNDNPICGKTVLLTGVNGQTYPAKIVDRCTGCDMSSLDLSEDFFNTVTNYGNGRVSGMHWVFE